MSEEADVFIPEMKEVGEELYCFLSEVRACNASCMAFVPHPHPSKGELAGVQLHCAVLTSLERTARHLPIIASVLSATASQKSIAAADRIRRANEGQEAPNPLKRNP